MQKHRETTEQLKTNQEKSQVFFISLK